MAYETGYYRVLKDSESSDRRNHGFVQGNLVHVVAGTDCLHVLFHDWHLKYDYLNPDHTAEFADFLEFEPGGMAIRQQEISTLMQEAFSTGFEVDSLQKQLQSFSPHAADSGELVGALVPVKGMGEVKMVVANIRNQAAKTRKDIQAKNSKLANLLSEQSKALAIKAEELQSLLKKAEEAIWSINLYLGKNEDIHILRTGIPAPADQKIVLRQTVLYMDEECAAYARSGGIDVDSVDKFDKWILADPSHLSQVLYEDKAVVALHIKRKSKSYGNYYVDDVMNQANLRWTYFLIRNGENLYRVFVEVDSGAYLFPPSDQFKDIFSGLKPGSRDYMKAIEHAEERHRHYLRILLILQGLIDRTPVFKPTPRVNLCDPAQSYDYVDFIYDAERVLTDGRPTFDKWQDSVNNQLEVGHRIIGLFDYSCNLRGDQRDSYSEGRIKPKSANYPQSKVLHTIDDRRDYEFYFKYDRNEEIYSRAGGYYQAKNRASCWVQKEDNFFLDFDSITSEEITYYMKHRQSRHLYNHMIPLLEVALELKTQEKKDEEPFRLLIIGQIMQRYKVSHEDADSSVDELIKWWKFKNRTHRALLSNDALALDMILSEYGARVQQQKVRGSSPEAKILESILEQSPDSIMIAHKKDNQYVAYVPHHPDQNIWVTEQLWVFKKASEKAFLEWEKKWQLVDKRYMKWSIIHETEKWKEWKINPQRSTVLTDEELSELVDKAVLRLDSGWPRNARVVPLFAGYDDDFEVKIWYSNSEPVIPQLLVSQEIKHPGLCNKEVKWDRKREGIIITKMGWESNYSSSSNFEFGNNSHMIRQWDDNLVNFRADCEEVDLAKERAKEISKQYRHVSRIITDQVFQSKIDQAKTEFYAEYGDPELWDDHLKSLELQKSWFSIIDIALSWYVERGENPVGQTVQKVLDTVRGWGFFETSKNYRQCWEVPKDLPLDFVIPDKPEEKHDED